MSSLPQPRRGEIWFARIPTDPADKGPRPVVIVSVDARNLNERADTVLVVPFTTTLKGSPVRVALAPGETGLREPSMAVADGITTIRKEFLIFPRSALRRMSERRLREIAAGVLRGMGITEGLDQLR